MAKSIPHLTKRTQVDKAKARLLALVATASVITVFALVASKTYYSEASYLSRVSGEKEKALEQLRANKAAVNTLVDSYKTFASQDPNVLGGTPRGNGERDGDNARLILDALPSKYDFPALATSLEKLLTGYSINSISGNDDAVVQDRATGGTPQPVDIPFTLNVSSDYAGIKNLATTFERSIRPFQILSLDLSGNNNILQVNVTAKTFYQPEKNLEIGTKVIK